MALLDIIQVVSLSLGFPEAAPRVLTGPVQRPRLARAGLVLDVDELLDARQMGRKVAAAIGVPLVRSFPRTALDFASFASATPAPICSISSSASSS